MLQKIRDNAHGWWTWLFVPLLIILFAFWGIGNYLGGSFSQNEVAKVNGKSVPISAFLSLYQSISNAQNPSQNAQIAQSLKLQVLQAIVNKTILTQGLEKLGLSVSDATLDQTIYQIPAFQQNGQFSMQLYQAFLQNIGQTTEGLRADLRQTYLINQFQNGLLLSQFALPDEIANETNYANMLRDVTYINIPVSAFTPKTQPADADIAAYYAAHQNAFMTPPQVKLAYVMINQSQFGTGANAAQAFSAALNEVANAAFQNPGSLDAVAKAAGSSVQTTNMIDTSHPSGILTNSAALTAALSNSVMVQGNNSNVINLSPTQAVVLRVTNSVPAQPLPLTQVKSQIISEIQAAAANKAAMAAINSIVSGVNQGGNLATLAQAYGFKTQTAMGVNMGNKILPQNVVNTLLGLGVNQAASISENGTYTIVEVMRAYPNPQKSVNVPPQAITGLWTQIEMGQYLAYLQDGANVKINQTLFKQNAQ